MSLHRHTPIEPDDARRAGGRRGAASGPRPTDRLAELFFPQGTTTTPPPDWREECTPLRTPRPYVKACGTGTLALAFENRVVFGALLCRSWNCPTCRKTEAAQLLDRLRRGMESRPELNRILLTLTIDPSKFEAVPVGTAHWDAKGDRTTRSKAVRSTTLWSGPTPGAFDEAAEAMSIEWRKLNDRLKSKAKRARVDPPGYFRVIELHRNGWPHYHVVIEHATWKAADIETQVRAWGLGAIVHTADLSLDDAIGEVAPYLVSSEKGKGSKAYQFAAAALPEGFRLHSSSKGFLGPAQEPDELPEHVLPLKGHFFSHHHAAQEYGADSRIVLNAPTDPEKPHRPPSSATTTGDGSRLYYLARLQETGAQLAKECSDAPPLEFDLTALPY